MPAAEFLDTNLFVYLVDPRDAEKQALARERVARAVDGGHGVISHQVVQETLHVLGHKFKVAVTAADREALLRELLVPMWKVQPSQALYEAALGVQQKHRFGFYDSLIVAAALEAGCRTLLTEDLQHGQRIGALRIENPFLA
jgi:predicted nucleic acid-binding protein